MLPHTIISDKNASKCGFIHHPRILVLSELKPPLKILTICQFHFLLLSYFAFPLIMLGVYKYEYTGGCPMIKLSNIKLIKIIKMFILEISCYKNKKKFKA